MGIFIFSLFKTVLAAHWSMTYFFCRYFTMYASCNGDADFIKTSHQFTINYTPCVVNDHHWPSYYHKRRAVRVRHHDSSTHQHHGNLRQWKTEPTDEFGRRPHQSQRRPWKLCKYTTSTKHLIANKLNYWWNLSLLLVNAWGYFCILLCFA